MKQLTIFDQLIGTTYKEGIIVGIKWINNKPMAMVYHCFQEASASQFHNNKYIYSKMWEL